MFALNGGNVCARVQTQHTDEDGQTLRHVDMRITVRLYNRTHGMCKTEPLKHVHHVYINTSHTETQAYTKAIKHVCTQTTLNPIATTLV